MNAGLESRASRLADRTSSYCYVSGTSAIELHGEIEKEVNEEGLCWSDKAHKSVFISTVF